MNELLGSAIKAHGGLDRWKTVTSVPTWLKLVHTRARAAPE